MMVDRQLNYTPDGKLAVLSELKVITLQVSVFLAV